jgi:replicative DNA helicase
MAKQNTQNILNIDIAGKIPPQALDMEEAVLGALLIEGSAFDRISLKPSYFYKDSHQKIFTSMQSLNEKNKKIDELTVTEELRKINSLDEIGGFYALSVLSSKVSGAWNIEEHASIIFEKFLKREFIRISNMILNMAFDDSEDSDNLLNFSYSELDKVNGEASDVDEMKSFKDIMKQSIENLKQRQKLSIQGKIMGIRTPVQKLTSWTNGWQNEDLIIIAARPSFGKTATALAIAKTAALEQVPVAFFSLEMKSVRLVDRLLIGESNVNADDFRSGRIRNEDWSSIENTINKFIDLPIYFDDRPKSINKIRVRAKALKRKSKCGLIIIDYLQLSSDSETEDSKRNREQEISSISRKAKLMAKELEVPVILLSQLNRALETRSDKRPQLSDLRESGAIEQNADVVIFINRPEKYGIVEDEQGNSTVGRSEFIIMKQREGKVGTIFFRFNDSLTAVYDYEEGWNSDDFKKDTQLPIF